MYFFNSCLFFLFLSSRSYKLTSALALRTVTSRKAFPANRKLEVFSANLRLQASSWSRLFSKGTFLLDPREQNNDSDEDKKTSSDHQDDVDELNKENELKNNNDNINKRKDENGTNSKSNKDSKYQNTKINAFIVEKIGNMTRRGNDYGSQSPRRQNLNVPSKVNNQENQDNNKKLRSWGRRPDKNEWNPLRSVEDDIDKIDNDNVDNDNVDNNNKKNNGEKDDNINNDNMRSIEELLKVDNVEDITISEMQYIIDTLENLFEETTGKRPSDHDIDEILISLLTTFGPTDEELERLIDAESNESNEHDQFHVNYQNEEFNDVDEDFFDDVPELKEIMRNYWSRQQLSRFGRGLLSSDIDPELLRKLQKRSRFLDLPIKKDIDLSRANLRELEGQNNNHWEARRRAYQNAMRRSNNNNNNGRSSSRKSNSNSNVHNFGLCKNHGLKSKNFEVITESNFTFADVGGMSDIKSQMMQCADMIQNFEKYENFNVRIPRGMLLTGPPGNGKTMLVKAFCGTIDASFIVTSGAEFQEKYVGVGPSKIRELFKLARDAKKPCVIFIDEIDGVGRKRHGDGESSSAERDSTLNELLVQLDGFNDNKGIFVVAATNAEHLLDSALIRPGRFDRKIVVPNPDEITRKEIINIHAEGKPRAVDVHCDHIVAETSGMSGAEVENVLNEAMLRALQENRYVFSKDDLNFAVTKQTVGYMSSTRKIDRENMYKIAIHEMGHAVVGYLMPHFYNLVSVRINLNSPNTPGSTHFELLESTGGLKSKDFMKEEIMVCLAGFCAETVFFGENNVLSGSSSDFEKARDLVFHMLTNLGMSDTGKIHYGRSEASMESLDIEIDSVLKELQSKTIALIKKNRLTIENLAQKLTAKGHLERKDIEPIILRHLS